ncbi:MAG: Gfo/Idh/MocA family oxidoreductase [bacterium]
MDAVKVGIVGCGNISGAYFSNMCRTFSGLLEVVACADQARERAKAWEAEFIGIRAISCKALMADPGIGIVVNLTTPKAHASVALQAIKAGKSVYNEKPLAITRREAAKMLALAKEKCVLVGGAPDTFMGGAIQTCRKLIDDGVIGDPVAATAVMMSHGPENWHPDPEFYYEAGGGPMFDVGPYCLSALIALLGPARRVTGSARASFPTRTITGAGKSGKVIRVEVPTHVAGIVDFASGTIATVITSFDVWSHSMPGIEIYGSKGSLQMPEPNGFGGPVRLRMAGDSDWQDVPLTHGYTGNVRGIGVADMARAIMSEGRPHRASGELAAHVLDIMHAFHDASIKGRHVELCTTCQRPAALPPGLSHGSLD